MPPQMSNRAHDRRCLALSQLETALRLHFEGEDFASVITLAGAADEVFGKLASARGTDNSLEIIARAASEIHQKLFNSTLARKDTISRANLAKNVLKHWNLGDPLMVNVDLREEASDMLNRAIDNYWAL